MALTKIGKEGITGISNSANANAITIDSGENVALSGTLGVTGAITGTLATAAQTNITSVGTLTSFRSTGIDDNADALAITIDNSEKVGIGTTSPQDELHVYLNSGQRVARFEANNTTSAHISFKGSNTSLMPTIGVKDEDLYLSTGDAVERMRIDASGNVGIGTTPSQKLHIAGAGNQFIYLNNTTTSDSFYFKAGSGASSIQTGGGSNVMNFFTSGNERMRIDASGNVGIGATPDPSVKLTVNGSVGPTNGTASLPTHTFYSDPNTGIYRPGSDNLGFAVGGQSKAFLSTTQFNITPPIVAQGGVKLGGNSYALDDYEEGSWTPTANEGTVSYATQFGRYRKIGNMVTYYMDLTINSISGCNALRLTLPFTSASGSVLYTGNFIAWDVDTAFNASGTFVRTFINPSSNLLLFYRTVSNGENISGTIANPTGRCAGMFIQFT